MISFTIVLMASAAMAQGLPASVASQIGPALSSYLASATAQPAIATLYSEVVSDVGGPLAWSDIQSQVRGNIGAPSSVLDAWETALPSSVRVEWDSYVTSLERAENSVVSSVLDGRSQATTISTPATTLAPATTSGPTAASAVGITETASSGHAAATGGSAVLGVAAGVAAAAGFVAAVL